jgi:hypothetical protein
VQRSSQRRPLIRSIRYVTDTENSVLIPTINALESAAWGHVDIVAVGTEQLDGIYARHIRPPAGNDIAGNAVNARARAENSVLVFLRLDNREEDVSSSEPHGATWDGMGSPSPAGQHASGCIAGAQVHTTFLQTTLQWRRLGFWKHLRPL